MRLQAIHDLAKRGLHLWAVTKDPLTLSACETLIRAAEVPLTPPEQEAQELLELQLAAYATLYVEPL